MYKRVVAALCLAASCQLSFVLSARGGLLTASSDDEAMVSSANPTTVWDPKGAVMIAAPTTAQPNSEYALMHFNTASVVSQLNTQYGNNGWTITSVGVTLKANFATAGVQPNNPIFNVVEPGLFTLSWLSNNGWVFSSSGGVTWNTLNTYLPGSGNSNLQEGLGTFNYPANGTSPLTWSLSSTSDFLNSIAAGAVTLYGTPADSQVGYLFNAPMQGNPAVLDITAQAVPEPSGLGLGLAGLALMGILGRRRMHRRRNVPRTRGDTRWLLNSRSAGFSHRIGGSAALR